MSSLRGRHWIHPTIRPLRGGSTIPPSRQLRRPTTSGSANLRAPTSSKETQDPTASTEVELEARGPLIKKYTKLKWSRKSTSPVCLKLAVRLDQGSSHATNTERAHAEDDCDIPLWSMGQRSGSPRYGPPGRPRASEPHTSTAVPEAKDARANAKLQSKLNPPRIRKTPFDCDLWKYKHWPFVEAGRSGTSHASRHVVNLVLHKHPTRAKEEQKPRRSLDRSGFRKSIHEQATRDRVDIPTDGANARIKHLTLSIDEDLHGFAEHRPPRTVKAFSKPQALAMAQMIRKAKTSLQPAIRKSGSLPSSAISKFKSQHESLTPSPIREHENPFERPALPPIRKEYGSAARSLSRRERGPARLVIRERKSLPQARSWEMKAGPLTTQQRDSWPRLLVRRHRSATDRNGSLSTSIIYSDITRRSSQNPAIALPRSG